MNSRKDHFGMHTLQCIAADVRAGFVEITHHGMATLGLAVIAVAIVFGVRPEFQTFANEFLFGWIQARQADGQAALAEPGPDRFSASALQALNPEQRSVAQWLSRKYRIAAEPLAALVTEAWVVGELSEVPPTLILAVMAAESGFNPFAQRTEGHRGLMQVDSLAQSEVLMGFGGPLSVFDPLTNLRVGSRVLQSMILEAGSVEAGLSAFASQAGPAPDPNYTQRVMNDHKQMAVLVQKLTQPAPKKRPSTGPERP